MCTMLPLQYGLSICQKSCKMRERCCLLFNRHLVGSDRNLTGLHARADFRKLAKRVKVAAFVGQKHIIYLPVMNLIETQQACFQLNH